MTLTPEQIKEAVELAATRFWSNVEIGETDDDCHVWTAHTNPKGYGRLHVSGKNIMAHRFAWILKNGPIPDGLIICHSCDNPSCVNWRHLWIGTHADNIRDRDEKGRNHVHSKDHYRKMQIKCARQKRRLSPDQIRAIRLSEKSCRSLAKKYGVDHSMIASIRRGDSYADVK